MTTYQDIYQDLPGRVNRVWQRLDTSSMLNSEEDLLITAMLMAAAAGLAMPFENLKDLGAGNKRGWDDHPAFQDKNQAQYKKSLKDCDAFLKQPISKCRGLEGALLLRCQQLQDIKAAACPNGQRSRNAEHAKARYPVCPQDFSECAGAQQHP